MAAVAQFRSCLLIATLLAICSSIAHSTAPEFTVTVDTDNFKEIRIPYELWKRIVAKGLNTKSPSKASTKDETISATKQVAEQVVIGNVTEFVLNVTVPSDDVQAQEAPLPEATVGHQQVLIEPMIPLSDSQAPEVTAAAAAAAADPVVEAAPAQNPISVLVQSFKSPCVCQSGICGCCATLFSQKGCAKMRFLSEDFSIDMRMTMNDVVMRKWKVPVGDSIPPFCFNPGRAPFVEVCAKLSGLKMKKQTLHACLDLDANIGGFDLFSWNYNCMKFGPQGFTSKPGERPAVLDFVGGIAGGGGDDDDDDDGGLFEGLFVDDDDDY